MTRYDSIFRASLWLWWRILGCQEWKHAGKPGGFVAEEEKNGGLDDSNGGDRKKERLWIVHRQNLQGPSLLATSDSTESNPLTLQQENQASESDVKSRPVDREAPVRCGLLLPVGLHYFLYDSYVCLYFFHFLTVKEVPSPWMTNSSWVEGRVLQLGVILLPAHRWKP